MLHRTLISLILFLVWVIPHKNTFAYVTLPCNYSIRQLPTQGHLPSANINVIMQSGDGYFWYGTNGDGLCRDDGYCIKTYSSKTYGKGIMNNDEIGSICEDQQGRIWFSTRYGLYILNAKNDLITEVSHEQFKQKKINTICLDKGGNMWVGVARSVIKIDSKGRILKELNIDDNPRHEVKDMIVDSHGAIWGTILRGGLFNIVKDRLTIMPWDCEAAASHIVEDESHQFFWIGTWGMGVVQYRNGRITKVQQAEPNTSHRFGKEVNNMYIDKKNHIMWVSTMDDLYAYNTNGNKLTPLSTNNILPPEKKLIGKIISDNKGNIWVPGISPHTFAVTWTSGGIRRDEVETMTNKMGYKIMVDRIVREGDYYWIFQRRTRLSLYNSKTGEMTFMATDAFPSPLSTQKVLTKCKNGKGVWSCYGKRLIHIWHEGMKICWEEDTCGNTPNYIASLNDIGNGKLLIGTEKQVFSYDYIKHALKQETDSVGIVHLVSWDKKGLHYSTDPNILPSFTDSHGHLWTLTGGTLTETNTKTGASRVIHATDNNVNMDYFTDMTITGDSICLGGIGAFCMIAPCMELDSPTNDDRIILTDSTHITSLNHLYADRIQYKYRFVGKGLFDKNTDWFTLETGKNEISYLSLSSGDYTLEAMCTDEYGRWSDIQQIHTFTIPTPFYLRWYAWMAYIIALSFIVRLIIIWKRDRDAQSKAMDEAQIHDSTNTESNGTPIIDPLAIEAQEFREQVTNAIMQNIDNPDYDAEQLATDMNLSRSNLYRRFQKYLDSSSPSEYLRTIRLEHGKRYLRETTLSVTEIAYKTGFSSSQYFAKCFKDAYNKTPKEYRSECRNLQR